MTQLALDLLRPLAPTLDNFVPGRNAEAVAALRMLLAGRLVERIVYLWGEPGCGRSHLLTALVEAGAARWTAQADPAAAGITVIDDVQTLDAAAQVALFNRVNEVRARPDAACVVAGDAAPSALPLREDLRTRLAWGYVYRLHALTDEQKAAALAAHAAGRGLRHDAEVIPFLLTHLPRDMRTLIAALDALDAFALARKRALTVALAREWLAGGGP
ncbi:MAG: DnaA regulatory inactivator Hda [Burkholderiaceae bacterium]|nr:DnaA regulatory inactivator Hda [Burkholderiaceae bacterium]